MSDQRNTQTTKSSSSRDYNQVFAPFDGMSFWLCLHVDSRVNTANLKSYIKTLGGKVSPLSDISTATHLVFESPFLRPLRSKRSPDQDISGTAEQHLRVHLEHPSCPPVCQHFREDSLVALIELYRRNRKGQWRDKEPVCVTLDWVYEMDGRSRSVAESVSSFGLLLENHHDTTKATVFYRPEPLRLKLYDWDKHRALPPSTPYSASPISLGEFALEVEEIIEEGEEEGEGESTEESSPVWTPSPLSSSTIFSRAKLEKDVDLDAAFRGANTTLGSPVMTKDRWRPEALLLPPIKLDAMQVDAPYRGDPRRRTGPPHMHGNVGTRLPLLATTDGPVAVKRPSQPAASTKAISPVDHCSTRLPMVHHSLGLLLEQCGHGKSLPSRLNGATTFGSRHSDHTVTKNVCSDPTIKRYGNYQQGEVTEQSASSVLGGIPEDTLSSTRQVGLHSPNTASSQSRAASQAGLDDRDTAAEVVSDPCASPSLVQTISAASTPLSSAPSTTASISSAPTPLDLAAPSALVTSAPASPMQPRSTLFGSASPPVPSPRGDYTTVPDIAADVICRKSHLGENFDPDPAAASTLLPIPKPPLSDKSDPFWVLEEDEEEIMGRAEANEPTSLVHNDGQAGPVRMAAPRRSLLPPADVVEIVETKRLDRRSETSHDPVRHSSDRDSTSSSQYPNSSPMTSGQPTHIEETRMDQFKAFLLDLGMPIYVEDSLTRGLLQAAGFPIVSDPKDAHIVILADPLSGTPSRTSQRSIVRDAENRGRGLVVSRDWLEDSLAMGWISPAAYRITTGRLGNGKGENDKTGTAAAEAKLNSAAELQCRRKDKETDGGMRAPGRAAQVVPGSSNGSALKAALPGRVTLCSSSSKMAMDTIRMPTHKSNPRPKALRRILSPPSDESESWLPKAKRRKSIQSGHADQHDKTCRESDAKPRFKRKAKPMGFGKEIKWEEGEGRDKDYSPPDVVKGFKCSPRRSAVGAPRSTRRS